MNALPAETAQEELITPVVDETVSPAERYLSTVYPQPLRVVLRDSVGWELAASVLGGLLLILDAYAVLLPELLVGFLQWKKSLLLAFVLTVFTGRIAYGFLYWLTYRYNIVDDRLYISRGVILRDEALLPLLPLTEIRIRRNWLDLVFGLTNVYIAVVLEHSIKLGEIRGLRRTDAERIRDLFVEVIDEGREREGRDPGAGPHYQHEERGVLAGKVMACQQRGQRFLSADGDGLH